MGNSQQPQQSQSGHQLTVKDLVLHSDGAGPPVAQHKPYAPASNHHHQSSNHHHNAAAAREFSLRVGRINEDNAEGQDVASSIDPFAGSHQPSTSPAGWLIGCNHETSQDVPFQPPPQQMQIGPVHGSAQQPIHAPSTRTRSDLGPEILQNLDPALPAMTRHTSNPHGAPGQSAHQAPLMDKSKSLPVLNGHPAQQWDPAYALTDSWLQDPSGLEGMPPEPGMLTDPPMPFTAQVPCPDNNVPHVNPFAQGPNPFATSPRHAGDHGSLSPGMVFTAGQQQHHYLPMSAPPPRHAGPSGLTGRSDVGAPPVASYTSKISTPFENSWHLGSGSQMECNTGPSNPVLAVHASPYQHYGQQDRASSYSSWAPSKQPSGTLTVLSHPSQPELSSYVSSQTDGLDPSGFYLPGQDSGGPGTSLSGMYSYGGRGKNSISSVRVASGPFEPDFWQPIDVEAEPAKPDDASEPWTPSLDGTSSLQLADLYTWLDDALNSSVEDPAHPSVVDHNAVARLSEHPAASSSPPLPSWPLSGNLTISLFIQRVLSSTDAEIAENPACHLAASMPQHDVSAICLQSP